MAEAPSPSVVDLLGVRLLNSNGNQIGMATLLSTAVALTVESLVDNHQEYFVSRLSPTGEERQVGASVVARDPRVGFAALKLDFPIEEFALTVYLSAELPPLDSQWESVFYSDAVSHNLSGLVDSFTTTDDRPRMLLSASEGFDSFLPSNALGSPVVINQYWPIGLISQKTHSGDYLAIPMASILESAVWGQVNRAMQSDRVSSRRTSTKRRSSVPKFDRGAFQERLSTSSLTALSHAVGIREAQGQDKMHMEHLIAGLFQKENGPTRTEFGRAGIDRNRLAQIVAKEVGTTLPAENTYSLQEAVDVALLSKHVEQAFQAAVALADANKSALADAANQSKDIRTRHLIRGALSVRDCSLVKALIAAGVKPDLIPLDDSQVTHAPRRRTQAGIRSDDPKGEDLLDIKNEVEALCTVLAAKDVKPPISLGLFGDWGSGKSFFMKKMEERFSELKDVARNGDSSFCENIVQLWFNAWHYMDTNLWASLATEIFDKLADELARQDALAQGINDPDYARAQLASQQANATQAVIKAEQEKSEVDAKVRASEQQLARVQSGDTAVSMSPQDVLRAGYRFAVQQPQVRRQVENAEQVLNRKVEEAAKTLNIDRPIDSVKEELLELRGIWGYLRAIALAVINARNKVRWFISLGLILAIAALLYWVLPQVIALAWLQSTWLRLSRPVLLVVAAIAPFLPIVNRAFKIIHEAIKANQESIERVRLEAEQKLQVEHEELRESAMQAQQKLEQANLNAKELTEKLENLRSDQQITNFIRQRQQSSDYTKYLGVIAKARNDFEQLSTLLAKEQERSARAQDEQRKRTLEGALAEMQQVSNGTDSGLLLPRIDRIILYIDDLDRCPERKVVDVLQAVHLLLAFPIFVVVVGVDPRWLLHSLRQHSQAFKNQNEHEVDRDEEGSHWQATPLNYLEKIFQIPFTLWPMGKSGFGKMVESLTQPPNPSAKEEKTVPPVAVETRVTEATETKPEPPADSPTEELIAAEQTPAAPVETSRWRKLLTAIRQRLNLGPRIDDQSSAEVAATESKPVADEKEEEPARETVQNEQKQTSTEQSVKKTTEIDPNPEHLQIRPWERNFMKELHYLIPSPRAAKRFVNIYRLLRAAVDSDEKLDLDEFIGNEARGKYRAALLLLAILTGYPDQATEILRELVEKEPGETWWQFIDSFRVRAEKVPVASDGKAAAKPKQTAATGASAKKRVASTASLINEEKVGKTKPDAKLTNGPSDAEAWAQLFVKLDNLRHVIEPTETCRDFIEWAPKVARYSFQSGRILLEGRATARQPRALDESETNPEIPKGRGGQRPPLNVQ